MYIDYDFYKNVYGGGLSVAEFNKLEPEAESYIKYLTYHNGDIFSKTDGAVQRALCTAVDTIAEHKAGEASGESRISSETNDGYSITRKVEGKDGETSEATLRRKVSNAVRVYLTPTGWLSAGVRSIYRG